MFSSCSAGCTLASTIVNYFKPVHTAFEHRQSFLCTGLIIIMAFTHIHWLWGPTPSYLLDKLIFLCRRIKTPPKDQWWEVFKKS